MAEHFVYHFEGKHPIIDSQRGKEGYGDRPLIDEVISEADEVISAIEQFKDLPDRNQRLLLNMSSFIIIMANEIIGDYDGWNQNFWGLYIVGSRARGVASSDSDLDLLSVGTFYGDQGFGGYASSDLPEGIFKDFVVEAPEVLPDEYNVGDVDRKYLVRATPSTPGVLPVDLSVVDLTFAGGEVTLNRFKATMDVDESGVPLSRIPLVEVTVAADNY